MEISVMGIIRAGAILFLLISIGWSISLVPELMRFVQALADRNKQAILNIRGLIVVLADGAVAAVLTLALSFLPQSPASLGYVIIVGSLLGISGTALVMVLLSELRALWALMLPLGAVRAWGWQVLFMQADTASQQLYWAVLGLLMPLSGVLVIALAHVIRSRLLATSATAQPDDVPWTTISVESEEP